MKGLKFISVEYLLETKVILSQTLKVVGLSLNDAGFSVGSR